MARKPKSEPEANGTSLVEQPFVAPDETPVAQAAPTEVLPASAEVPPEPQNGTRPAETFSVPCGGGAYAQASIWPRKIEYDGRVITVYSVSFRKSYKDATTGEWKNTTSFRGSELYCVQHVLQLANQWILNARTSTSSECPF